MLHFYLNVLEIFPAIIVLAQIGGNQRAIFSYLHCGSKKSCESVIATPV